MEEIINLGFGGCKLQVQVPSRGEIEHPSQLIGKNIVSSFTGLAEKYFAHLEKESGIVNGASVNGEKVLKTKIKYVGGSVEAACALGVADGIVDLVGKSRLLNW